MRLLFTLILSHYFSYVFPDDCNDVMELDKFYVSRSADIYQISIRDGEQDGNFLYSRLNSIEKCQANKKKVIVKFKELVSRWHGKELAILGSCQCSSCDEISKHHYRKLLGCSDDMANENSIQNEKLNEIDSQLHNIGLNGFFKGTKRNTEDHGELWNNWSNWSTCSVTCGNGRQVRWRHCLGGDCTKGLKKAQIKTCRQKQCDSKTILHWLGIKS